MEWRASQVIAVREWAEGLRSYVLSGQPDPFLPGQFLNLGLDLAGQRVARSFSCAAPHGLPLEFFAVRVPGGAFSTALFQLEVGAPIWFTPRPAGVFTLEHVPDAATLWLIASGTGLGPYLAMLRGEEPWRRFQRLVLVHGVREVKHLAYRAELGALSAAHQGRLRWIPVVSREPSEFLSGRIPERIADGSLEARAEARLAPDEAQVLLCGNPGLLGDAQQVLAGRGLTRNRRRQPGHVTTEAYWR